MSQSFEETVRHTGNFTPVGKIEDAQNEHLNIGMPVFADADVPHPLFRGRWRHVQGLVVGLGTYLVDGTKFTRVSPDRYNAEFTGAQNLKQAHVQLSPSGVIEVHRADKAAGQR